MANIRHNISSYGFFLASLLLCLQGGFHFIMIFIILDIQSVPGKNCLYINNHRIQETSCLNSDVTAICGPEGN